MDERDEDLARSGAGDPYVILRASRDGFRARAAHGGILSCGFVATNYSLSVKSLTALPLIRVRCRPVAGRYSIAGIVANAILMWTCGLRYPKRASTRSARDGESRCKENEMNGSRYYGVRVEGAKFGVGFGSALAIAISYSDNHSILWAIIDGILGWLYVVYFALFRG